MPLFYAYEMQLRVDDSHPSSSVFFPVSMDDDAYPMLPPPFPLSVAVYAMLLPSFPSSLSVSAMLLPTFPSSAAFSLKMTFIGSRI
jgi:hypothetical protein